MDKRKEELVRITKDLEQFLKQHCERTPNGYNDFVGESCDTAFHMLQDTLRRIREEQSNKK
jgi:hypothetical protein